jgi:hypothetical protein
VAKKSLEGESRGKSKSELEKINSRIKASKSEQAQLANLEVEVVLTKNRGLEPLSVTPNSVKTEDLKLPSQLSRGYESRSSKRGKQHYDALEPKECGSQMIGSNQPVHRHEQSTGNYSQNSRGLPQNILAGPKKSSESNLERTTSDQKGGFYTLLRGIQSTSEAKPISYTSSRK